MKKIRMGRLLLPSGIALLLLSCGQQTDKNETRSIESIPQKDTVAEMAKIDTTTIQTIETVSPNQQELNEALTDPTIDNYYKKIYIQQKLIATDDSKMLSIPKSLFINNSDKDLFFFVVFTKSMNGSDGFYSEAVGRSAFEFVTKKTEQFADYFNVAPKLTDQDMDNWAEYVYGEIQISREHEEEKAVKEMENILFENIKTNRKEYKIVIERFMTKIKKNCRR
jgi:hypothetical protein